jgi:anti-sigma factor RsiW
VIPGHDHSSEELSAFLDDELAPAERAALLQRLSTCEECAAGLHAVARVRAAVRGLPPVEPPFGFFASIAPRRRWHRPVAAVLTGAAAAVVALGLVAPPSGSPVVPSVARLAETHASTASVEGDVLSQFVPAGAVVSFDR